MKAYLALEDGRIFQGLSFGAEGECFGEVVFNTSLTGYQEVLTDPPYRGQIVTMTNPLIGNYGVNREDEESRKLWLSGFAVRELSPVVSNWRSESDLDTYLKSHGVLGIQGIDTRALTKHIRLAGAMKAILSTVDKDPVTLVGKARRSPGLVGRDLVTEVSCERPYEYALRNERTVVVFDFGVKRSILDQLAERDCSVLVVPARTTAAEVLNLKPDGVVLSNGPGDPAALDFAVEAVREILAMETIPVFGICLGQQLLGLALGGRTYKLKFGHHGGNHPVKDLENDVIGITVQNHGFNVDAATLDPADVEITHVNLNDGTVEGFRHRRLPAFSVQFHPEAGPGPHDGRCLFDRFVGMMETP